MSHDIIAIIPVYNDVHCVKRLSGILVDMGISSIWGDGKFPLFKSIGNSSISTDGTREIIKSTHNAVLMDYPDMTLPDKLTTMLKMAGDMGYKYAVFFGADEIPSGDFEALTIRLDKATEDIPLVLCLPFKTKDEHVYSLDYVERIFKYPSRISARGAHYMFFRDDDTVALRCPPFVYNEVIISHDHTIRNSVRDKMMTDYQIQRIGQEKAELQAELIGITTEVNYVNLKKIYPEFAIDEDITDSGRKVFYIRNREGFRIDPSKLIHNWKRQRHSDGLIVISS